MKRPCRMCMEMTAEVGVSLCGMCKCHVSFMKLADMERDRLWKTLKVIVDCPGTADELDAAFFCSVAPKELP